MNWKRREGTKIGLNDDEELKAMSDQGLVNIPWRLVGDG